jgi:predicted transglutaminase-like cysteine proteinase
MRDISAWVAAMTGVLIAIVPHSSMAGNPGRSDAAPQPMIQHIVFQTPTLAPMAFTVFCLNYASQCKLQGLVSHGGLVRLTEQRMEELKEVNDLVNTSILSERNDEGIAGEKWLIAPPSGDCNDYAVTKRSELLNRGWSARVLLLSEVATPEGEHHLVLVVRTRGGDLVLDNMTDSVSPWSEVPYQWVRMQTPNNPNYWATIADRRVGHGHE